MSATIRVHAFTDTGAVREHNEDCLLVGSWLGQPPRGAITLLAWTLGAPAVCAVADGMGGHARGDLASRVALTAIAAEADTWTSAAAVASGVATAHARVAALGADPRLRGTGTTVAGLALASDTIVRFNVGDSRVYRITDGFVEQLSIDDAVRDEQGAPTNVLTQSLGQPGDLHDPHCVAEPLADGRYLICSDGISGVLGRDELRASCLRLEPADIVADLVARARALGAPDNLSVLVVDIECDPPDPIVNEEAS